MDNHNKRIKFHLNEKELKKLDRDAQKLGLSRSAYVRHLVNTIHPKSQPEISYVEYLPVLQEVSVEMERIADQASKHNSIDAEAYQKAMDKLTPCIRKLLNAVHQTPAEGGDPT